MEINKIYYEFTIANREYIDFITNLSNTLVECGNEDMKNTLLASKNKFEFIKIRIDDIEINENNNERLKHLKYIIMDAIFVTVDLLNFYSTNQVERFKMRAVNYINKDRMQKFIMDNPFKDNN